MFFFVVQEYVRWLQISMDDTVSVEKLQPIKQLSNNAKSRGRIDLSILAFQVLREGSILIQLHLNVQGINLRRLSFSANVGYLVMNLVIEYWLLFVYS